jgi:UDP-glucose 4-epimerase
MRALVTGGAGFIGSNLADALLARGDDVTVLDDFSFGNRDNVSPDAKLVEHDVREPFKTDAEVVFHLAAQADVQTSMKRPAFDAAVNVVGTVNVLNAAQAGGAQVIFTSSGGAGYGECPGPVDETFPFLPLSPYGIAKKCGEEYLAGWNRIHDTKHIALRLGNVFGPRQGSGLEGGVVAIFLEQLFRSEETTIFGDGAQTRDFVYVGDVVDALLAAQGRSGGPYNIGTGVETSVRTLLSACAEVAGSDDEPRLEPARLGDVQRSVLDSGLAKRELGWQARVDLASGLTKTFAWMQESGSLTTK